MKSYRQILLEMTSHRREAENTKAAKRISDFWDRSKGDGEKFLKQVNLRTKKMTKIEKLQIWASELEAQNMHDAAEVAFMRLKTLGG
jgi:predicted metal-dependent hydrolase